jgi:hypothetical protein
MYCHYCHDLHVRISTGPEKGLKTSGQTSAVLPCLDGECQCSFVGLLFCDTQRFYKQTCRLIHTDKHSEYWICLDMSGTSSGVCGWFTLARVS